MTDDDRRKTAELVALEQAGGVPPGYAVKTSQGLDDRWTWSSVIDGQLRMATTETEEEAKALAWFHFWKGLFGWLPTGYTVASDPSGHIWTLLEDGKPSRKSLPKASLDEARVEAWVDWKCVVLGLKRRPVTVDASSDPRSIMATFQQSAFELVTVELDLRRLGRRRDVLVNEMERLGIAFNAALSVMDAEKE